jgi:hypothetical protein
MDWHWRREPPAPVTKLICSSGGIVSDSTSRKALNLHGAIKMSICPLKIIRGWARCSIKAKAEMLDLGRRHWPSMSGEHFSEVLRESIDLLLEEEKGGTDGIQLPFVNDKGEFLHRVLLASKLISRCYNYVRRKQGRFSVYERKVMAY